MPPASEGSLDMVRKLVIAAATLMALATAANAQNAPSVSDYALQHPTEDARLNTPPSIGASVPQNVQIHQPEGGDGVYGYFYYEGRPVIVDMGTRAIVRIG
jgi:hypothetical protein